MEPVGEERSRFEPSLSLLIDPAEFGRFPTELVLLGGHIRLDSCNLDQGRERQKEEPSETSVAELSSIEPGDDCMSLDELIGGNAFPGFPPITKRERNCHVEIKLREK